MPEANQEVKGKMDGTDDPSVPMEKALSKVSSRTLIFSCHKPLLKTRI